MKPGQGAIRGRVVDGGTGNAISGVRVILQGAPPPGGGEPMQEIATTDFAGVYEFPSLPVGSYSLSFVKGGFKTSQVTGVLVRAGSVSAGDFPMPAVVATSSSQILDLDAFVVEAAQVGELMDALEIRMDSDIQVNVMSAEDFSKFASSDVADAIKRVAGVNVVEGQFAIIRGLEDRYSSTTFNGAPVPSPDPDRQSVQLDLFPSEIVSNLVIAKTFVPALPSNSAGGSIDIVTTGYPEEFQVKIRSAGGFNENAIDRFFEYRPDNPFGKEVSGTRTLVQEWGASLGGTKEFFERDFRVKAIVNWETDYVTANGTQENREPRPAQLSRRGVRETGDLAFGELNLSGGKFDFTESVYEEQFTVFGGFGADLDEAGKHKVDVSTFYTDKEVETVEVRENGFIPGLDYAPLAEQLRNGDGILRDDPAIQAASTLDAWIIDGLREGALEQPSRGFLLTTNFEQSRSFRTRRDLLVIQANGEHDFSDIEVLEGLEVNWVWNRATTNQEDTVRGVRAFYEPCGISNLASQACPEGVSPIEIPNQPSPLDALGPGQFAAGGGIFYSELDVKEIQNFGRLDGAWERGLTEWLDLELSTGGWFEFSKRDVSSLFLATPQVFGGATEFAIFGDTRQDLGVNIFSGAPGSLLLDADGVPAGSIDTKNEAKRQILGGHVGAKTTFLEKIDVLGGVRLEQIRIETQNDAFTDLVRFGTPDTYPTRYLFFDRLDNSARGETVFPPGTIFNDEILGIDVEPYTDPATGFVDLFEADVRAAINTEIDEFKVLPAAGFAYRPIEGVAIKGAYSQTVARPSFREMGFYVTVDPGTDDLVIGNPQLQLSDVESFDLRIEYFGGQVADLLAVSGFYKRIDDAIESIVVRDPTNASGNAQFRTFFNNPSQAKLWGIEGEFRKYLDFFGDEAPVFLDYLSIGGNATYINAKIKRSAAEIQRSDPFFAAVPGDPIRFTSLEESRRLFGQPEWIVNGDLSFAHPDWGTTATLAVFAISDILDAAGVAQIGSRGPEAFTLDRYVGAFYQLDLIVSQDWVLPRGLGVLNFKMSAKNLTDSRRKIIYDQNQLSEEVRERDFRIGRDYKLSVTYTIPISF